MTEPITISFSTYSALMNCGKKITFKRQGAKGPLSSALLYGQVFHHTLRRLYLEEADPVATTKQALDCLLAGQPLPGDREQLNWDGSIMLGPKDTPPEVMRTWIPEAVKVYRARQPVKPDALEIKLERQYPGFTVLGYVDAMRQGTVLDYKLANTRYKPNPLQAAFYALLSRGPIKFEYHVMRKAAFPELEIIPVPEANDPNYLHYVETMILPQAAQLLTLPDFPANPSSFLCSPAYCEYWKLCMGRVSRAKISEEYQA